MKMDYVSSNCEGKARELLAPLTGACPDWVWENVSIALDEKRKEAENRWMNRISNAPRVPLIAASFILVVTISSWVFFTHKSGNLNESVKSTAIVNTVPVKAPENKVNATVIQTAEVKKDSIQTQPSVKNQEAAMVQNNMPVAKNDGSIKNTGLNVSNKPVQAPAISQKDDNKPILIQRNAVDPQIITNDQQTSKGGVAVDLGSSDNSSSHPTAEMGAVEDTTAQ